MSPDEAVPRAWERFIPHRLRIALRKREVAQSLVAGALGALVAGLGWLVAISSWLPLLSRRGGELIVPGVLLIVIVVASTMMDLRASASGIHALHIHRTLLAVALIFAGIGASGAGYLYLNRLQVPGDAGIPEVSGIPVLIIQFAVVAFGMSLAVTYAVGSGAQATRLGTALPQWLLQGLTIAGGVAVGLWAATVILVSAPAVFQGPGPKGAIGFIGVDLLFSFVAALFILVFLGFTMPAFLFGAIIGGYLRRWSSVRD